MINNLNEKIIIFTLHKHIINDTIAGGTDKIKTSISKNY
jgi:hypothetical protein